MAKARSAIERDTGRGVDRREQPEPDAMTDPDDLPTEDEAPADLPEDEAEDLGDFA
jgi:hypothetical protein